MWCVDVYDSNGKPICHYNVTTQDLAERVAINVTRHAKVKTKITKVHQNEAAFTH